MFTTETIAGIIPAVPRLIGYQPSSESTTVVGITEHRAFAGVATLQERSQATGEAIHWIMRKLRRENPQPGQRVAEGLVVLWSDETDDPDLEWLALDTAASAHPSAAPVTVVQASTDATRWRRPAGGWQPSIPDSLAVVSAVAAGLAPPTGGRAERVAAWQHDPTLAASVAGHLDHTWLGPTIEARRDVVNDVWSVMVAANTDPDIRPDALGTVIAALNAPFWLRDTLMVRIVAHWHTVTTVMTAVVRAADDTRLPAVASVAAVAAFAAGDELAGREALIRAVTAGPDHSLTALLDQAESIGAPMTSTCRNVMDSISEDTTLATGLQP